MTRRGHLASAAVIAGLLAAAVVGTVRADGPAAAAADPFQVPNGNSAQLAAFIQNTVSKPYNAEGAVKAPAGGRQGGRQDPGRQAFRP